MHQTALAITLNKMDRMTFMVVILQCNYLTNCVTSRQMQKVGNGKMSATFS